MTGRRAGLLGGTFNPVHYGHLKLAELALAALALDEVRFIPTATPPHKPVAAGDPGGTARLRLLAEALGAGSGRPFTLEPLEVERGGPSFTVDTLEALAAREPGTAWIFLMGSDQLAGFPAWRRPERILELASLAVAARPAMALATRSPLWPAEAWRAGSAATAARSSASALATAAMASLSRRPTVSFTTTL